MSITQTERVNFGKRSGLKCHPVSLGAMRLPKDTNDAVKLIRQAIDAGMTYIDTSRGYGDSEIKLAHALRDGYREKVILSTKWCPWNLKIEADDDTSAERTYKRIREQLTRLDVDYVDFYQIWSINNPEQFEQATVPGGMLDGIRRAIQEGFVRHTGFTTHDSPANILRYIDQADWCETILCSYNMTRTTYQEVLAKAHAAGIATIVMNPIGGGVLAKESPALKEAIGCDSIVEIAHRYLAGDPNVDTILCGVSKLSDITNTIENFAKPPLTADERLAVEKAVASRSAEALGLCTNCGYCKPCPENIDIPAFMCGPIYLERGLGLTADAQQAYDNALSNSDPTTCTQCGACEQKCTQKIAIIKELQFAVETFGPQT